MKNIIESALKLLAEDGEFSKLAAISAKTGKGIEISVIPFLNYQLIRAIRNNGELDAQLVGIGPWLLSATQAIKTRSRVTFDCGLAFKKDAECLEVYGIELKGPSKDAGYLKREMLKDAARIEKAVRAGKLMGGCSIGIFAGASK